MYNYKLYPTRASNSPFFPPSFFNKIYIIFDGWDYFVKQMKGDYLIFLLHLRERRKSDYSLIIYIAYKRVTFNV